MLTVKNLKKIYKIGKNEVNAIKDVSFELPNGKLVAIVGPSGCGKTSLMNILGTLDRDFEGDIFINEKSLKQQNKSQVDSYRKNTIGFIFQQFNLLNSQTSMQNVELALELSGVSKQQRYKESLNLLEKVGLSNQAKKRVNKLSGGQKQRVAIARALANDPEIILADEPTGSLDEKTGKQIMDLLKDISKEKLVIMVTHSEELSSTYADIIIRMEDGKIISIEENNSQIVSKDLIKNKLDTKSKMKFFTAFKLSVRNALLRKGRTIATAIGTSIGIIGITMALSITTGTKDSVNTQVKSIFPSNSVVLTINDENLSSFDSKERLVYVKDIQEIMNYSDNFYAYYSGLESNIEVPIAQYYSLDPKVLTYSPEDLFNNIGSPDNKNDYLDYMTNFPLEDIKDSIQYGKLPSDGALNELVLSLSTAEILIKNSNYTFEDLIGMDLYGIFIDRNQFMNIDMNSKPITIVKPFKIVGISNTSTLNNTFYSRSDWNINYYQKEFGIEEENLGSFFAKIYAKNVETLNEDIEKINSQQDKYELNLISKTITDQVNKTLSQVLWGLLGFSSISVLVAVIMISVVIYISVLQRTNEIGILRAIGARKKDISRIFVSESVIIGLLSSIIALGISSIISLIINNLAYSFLGSIINNPPYIKISNLKPEYALGIILFTVVISLVAGLYPSIKASKLDPIKALKYR